ncbi:MAG: hypothetical protein IPJ33_08980 [Gammaproteobacteria bacterium]|jgi:hypothetical protein|nr:hypothetical protein [Gammaproteobacteria bacterium]MBP6051301.1 hypothetical protein [Pseudomonadales bacterium]MBK6581647.1 hypothetical protein [Gammaproteobacteria bacterium]MBK7170497.1 hypothetical protein [Gammaproteobacteria bacterium]MBK7522407.1 hypothetical protein [Gammaproteobacteria bacterium]
MARAAASCLPALLAACLVAGCQSGHRSTSPVSVDEPHSGGARVAKPSPVPLAAPPQGPSAPTPTTAPEDFGQLLRTSYAAYQSGDYENAMLGYERVVGHAEDPRDQVRSLISLAMIRLLPSSKMKDAQAAAIIMEELERRVKQNDLQYEFFGELELLELIQGREGENARLRAANAQLRKSLADKEELVRQLRALSVDGG